MCSSDLIKVKVASASTALSWLLVLVFLAVWLPLWANLELVSRLATQLLAEHSAGAVYGLAVLAPIAGMFLTWRSLVSHLWTGLSGLRPLFLASAFSLVALVTAVMLDVGPRDWLLRDPSRFRLFVWLALGAVIAKCSLAAYLWRGVSLRHVRGYLMVWLAGTASLLALGIAIWGLVRTYLPFDGDRLRTAVILLALLAVPLARVGLAPSSLVRNRHRSS